MTLNWNRSPTNLRYKSWQCDCFSNMHSLEIMLDDDGSFAPILSVQDVIRPYKNDGLSLRGWWERLRAAWHVLCGCYCCAEVILTPETAREIAAYLNAAAMIAEAKDGRSS